ncbi:sigma factor-like helix-turn-helix DNA-binding protein [Corynebacterium sp.]|uniref:sigma factor-like helix-turn-helix DNA-binding protein n=1 Tax=Mycobacteriales TaxID=85007 RepID=UPI0026DF5ED3|nr:sigma factor-like helix-turn-helix DNA-binding protein [Corynebacterium sp.]MDO5512581.1 sigma factor-like helix-turn-helix DNA-binding protein [Corynebacterium sp.]
MQDLDDQTGIGDQTGVESWLRWDLDELEDCVDRRGGDLALYRALQRKGFKGARQNEFEDVLAKYGLAVIAAWMVKGRIGEKCREHRLSGASVLDGIDLNHSHIEWLVMETVSRAIWAFREDVLPNGKWKPHGGASLRTYFIGQCLIRYIDVAKNWRRQRTADEQLVPFSEKLVESGKHTAVDNVEADVIHSEMLEPRLSRIKNEDARAALIMQLKGFKIREIAEHLGRTDRSVEGMLKYAKKQIERGEEGTA